MLKKKFLKTKPTCEVTFELPDQIAAKNVSVVGDFNDWDPGANPLKKRKGVWQATLKLEQGREFQYRYFVNGGEWYNDFEADNYVPNNIDGENSVVNTFNNN